LVQALVDDGQLTPSQARVHPARSMVTKALQGQEVEPDLSLIDTAAGDRILICSDGLTDVVSDEVIEETLGAADPLDRVADALVSLGLAEGGPDNITVVLAEVEAAAPEAPTDQPTYYLGAAVDPYPGEPGS
jgi:PPM family protein phosphatase